MNELLTSSGTHLAHLIRTRKVSSMEAVEAHIKQIERVNPRLNAVVKDRFQLAREEARLADAAVLKSTPENLPPYHGVPCTIKECFAVEGFPQTGGLVVRKDFIAKEDAIAVARLRKAGAIPLGITNVPELCMWIETNNKVYGRTNNPYDQKRIVGGSSGGEGAIIGAGGSPFGLGSDIGGSIRSPAFFNGVFGHKPTGGLVPGTGMFPLAEGEARSYVTTGPLCRRAEDLMPLLRVLAGPDGQDYGCTEIPIGDLAKVELSDIVVWNVEDNGRVNVSDDLRGAQARVSDALREVVSKVETIQIAELRYSIEIWSALLAESKGPTFSELLGNGRPVHASLELLKWCIGVSPHTFPAIGLALLEGIPKLLGTTAKKYVDMGLALRKRLTEMLGTNSVILYPSYSSVAPRHNMTLFPPIDWMYTGIWNMMKFPSTQVPLGLNANGLPLGVQVVGGPGQDHLTIAVALQLEKLFGGWVPPKEGLHP